ncbi:mechanosensitive ion channel family protein [Frankia sp. QA3]|uniref:mechanosensitive ion channel family protein n=1 Tax=Frankia sp. QA3 TaxID=710111 RepID=UPI000269C3C1|nr:mechanosensitive ion channel family protein [Frankia sp. QA3]EIV94763.1 small-conductance mechanosensitive channel [Frankia sp. QA3]
MRVSAAPDLSFSNMQSTIAVLTVLVGAVVVAVAAAMLLHRVALRIGRHSQIVADLAHRGRRPVRLTLILLALLIGLNATHEQDWTQPAVHVCDILLIAGIGWCIAVLAFVFEELALARYRVDVVDNRHARRVRTQVTLMRRITVAIISIIAGASMLMTIPSVRVAGASIFASAGVVGIVAGLAAQTSLANVFAGLQLAFTDAIRVDDVVVVEEEWGRIEEITLTYVVVHIWDDRRMILPSTYFTTTPFQNWTRKESAVLGAVELDLDWEVPLEEMRAEMHRVLEATDLWDQRVCVLQVTDAVGDHIRIRVLVSGKDGPTTFDLRCHVREALVLWVQRNHPHALPRTRIEFDAAAHLSGPGHLGLADDHRDEDRHNGAGPYGAKSRRDGAGDRDGGAVGTLLRERDDRGRAPSDRLRKRDGARRGWEPITTITLSTRDGHGSHLPPTPRTPDDPADPGRTGNAADGPHPPHADAADDARLFSGASPDAAQRARDFSETPDHDTADPPDHHGDDGRDDSSAGRRAMWDPDAAGRTDRGAGAQDG